MCRYPGTTEIFSIKYVLRCTYTCRSDVNGVVKTRLFTPTVALSPGPVESSGLGAVPTVALPRALWAWSTGCSVLGWNNEAFPRRWRSPGNIYINRIHTVFHQLRQDQHTLLFAIHMDRTCYWDAGAFLPSASILLKDL